MPRSASSSVQQARQLLADRLRELVKEAGLDGKDLAALCGWHPSKVSRISTGKTQPSEDDIRAWCAACGAESQTEDLIASLRAVEGMWVSWCRMERAGLRRAQESVQPLFERTRWFRAYSSWLVPGLLQTYGYTEAVLRAVQRRRVPVDDVADAVAVRMERQRVLTQGQRRFAFLVEESVLRNGYGDADTQAEQLERLHALAEGELPNVALGVVPARLERVRMPVEGFWIYDKSQVNVELVSGHLTVTQPSEIAMYADTFAALADMAVYGTRARVLITKARDALV
ncbi:helix-turn-helix domain-containing protein [Streptomyces alkaliterrae]|uniref:Helix-turn-helix domain-containing protein n=1 Tax=Streptomyces alkaliterrae TaxID=2213162 RepID=A0A5P0YSP5_9ACTN|nr:helix-turn-helix transcriptional regulator [Streptomyces alkaliterrae]MBB1254573.1 helix-turn-helix transcriptional regulator [Streptomyces alkaliterrae]MBB1259433.1 helix-turn-helix transcriptional regulator [Streptomyces alkaliterrae]MQS02920.1 helix-turn-helix domain-containing protein [Streptomyces alkaliterrae]